eukprot:g11328.t1
MDFAIVRTKNVEVGTDSEEGLEDANAYSRQSLKEKAICQLAEMAVRSLLRQSRAIQRTLRAGEGGVHHIKVMFALPDETLKKNELYHTVTIPSTSGVTGISANQPPSVHQLLPGVINLHKTGTLDVKTAEKYFISGGFAILDKQNVFSISAAEAIKLEDLDKEKVNKLYIEAKAAAESSGGKTPAEIAEAGFIYKLYSSMLAAVNTM